MLGRKPTDENKKLDEVKAKLLEEMLTYDPNDEEFKKNLDYLERVNILRRITRSERKPLDMNTVVLALTNLAGILVIVAYEQRHVFTSRGQSFILKPK